MSIEASGPAGASRLEPAVGTGGTNGGSAAPGEIPPELPEGAPPADGTVVAHLSALDADLQIRSQGTRRAHQQQRAAAERKARFEALRKQLRSRENQSFWESVANVAKVVGAVAAVAGAAFTGGSTLLVAAAIVSAGLTAGSMATGGTMGLDEIGVDRETAGFIVTGAQLLAAAASVAGAFGGAAGAASTAAEATSGAASTARTAAKVGEAGARGAETFAKMQSGGAAADAVEHGADADLASALAEDARADRDAAIRTMKDLARTRDRVFAMWLEGERAREAAALAAVSWGRSNTRA